MVSRVATSGIKVGPWPTVDNRIRKRSMAPPRIVSKKTVFNHGLSPSQCASACTNWRMQSSTLLDNVTYLRNVESPLPATLDFATNFVSRLPSYLKCRQSALLATRTSASCQGYRIRKGIPNPVSEPETSIPLSEAYGSRANAQSPRNQTQNSRLHRAERTSLCRRLQTFHMSTRARRRRPSQIPPAREIRLENQ